MLSTVAKGALSSTALLMASSGCSKISLSSLLKTRINLALFSGDRIGVKPSMERAFWVASSKMVLMHSSVSVKAM